jgi:hypothetical protein
MTQIVPSLTDEDILAGVRAFLLAYIIDPGGEVVGDVDNRVSMPKPPYIVMNHLAKPRIATNIDAYRDEVSVSMIGSTTTTVRSTMQPTKYGLQLDCVGPTAGDWSQALSTLWFSDVSTDFLAAYNIFPLYADDPKHSPWVNGEQQWESRWIVNVYMQVNPVLEFNVPSFATDTIEVGIIDVEIDA